MAWERESGILYKDECYTINGAIFDVYREMGCGFVESVYEECLVIEFARRGIPFVAQPELKLSYKDQTLTQIFRPDFVCFDAIVVELKAVKAIAPEHLAQVLNYLKATGSRLGLLVNFGAHPKATIQRLVL
ncbi:MAG: GxxExxY protein [Planctomycetaceae bacterium]